MKNHPTLETITAVPVDTPGRIDVETCCDHCEQPASEWPTGLVSIDREHGVFTCDFTCCPTCAVDANFAPHDGLLGLIRGGTTFAYIYWYWFLGKETPNAAD